MGAEVGCSRRIFAGEAVQALVHYKLHPLDDIGSAVLSVGSGTVVGAIENSRCM